MNNTEKLLRALIDAQGFDIETITESFDEKSCVNSVVSHRVGVRVVDYKVTKKRPVKPDVTFSAFAVSAVLNRMFQPEQYNKIISEILSEAKNEKD